MAVYCIVYYNVYYNVYCYYCGVFIEKYVYHLIGYCVSELHGHICPYRNVWPEAVYCCFTRTYNVYRIVYMFVCSELEVAITSPSFVTL